MDQILEECPGCIRITDDITINGCTEVEHYTHLRNLMQLGCKYDLVFNPQKTQVKAQAVNFFGCLYNASGVHPDLGKVNAVHALLAPTNITKLQEFLGLVRYLSPFIPGLSTLTAPLHELLKKDTDFTWICTYDATFQHVKEAVVSNTTLRYFDSSVPVTIQVNVSQVGLGAALLQNGKPVAFASKALTGTECWYANIEREMLAVIFRGKRFQMYIYSRSFAIKSDHKLLNPSPRRTWQTHQPICSTCYCASRAMIIPSVTALVRKWPCPTHSLGSVQVLDLISCWTLPSTMLACPQRGRKHSNKPLLATPRCMLSLT